jgi:excisionase family DNA binding protein
MKSISNNAERFRFFEGWKVPELWVSVENVMSYLCVAKDSVYRWIDGRGRPEHKIGRLWKFKLSDVDAWMRADGADAGDEPKAAPAPKQGGRR